VAPGLVADLISEAESEGRPARVRRLRPFIAERFSVDRVIEAIEMPASGPG